MFSFKVSRADAALIERIATRAMALYVAAGTARQVVTRSSRKLIDIEMDLTATHANGCPLRLADLLAADDGNLMHDVSGIYRHLDRDTGELTGHFRPRFAAPDAAAEAA